MRAAQISPVVALLSVKEGVSRLHASRRVFDVIQRNNITVPVVHHARYHAGAIRCVRPQPLFRRAGVAGGGADAPRVTRGAAAPPQQPLVDQSSV